MFRALLIFASLLGSLAPLHAQIKVKARVDESATSSSSPKSTYKFTHNMAFADLGWALRGNAFFGYERVIGDYYTARLYAGPTFRDPLDDLLKESFIGANDFRSVSNSPSIGFGAALRYYPYETGRFEGFHMTGGLNFSRYSYSGTLRPIDNDPASALKFSDESVSRVNLYFTYGYSWELIKNEGSSLVFEAGLTIGYTIDRFNILSAISDGKFNPTYTLQSVKEGYPSYLITPHVGLGYGF